MGSVSSKGRLLSTMARGPKRHMKRLNAPKHWMLDKMGGTWAPRPSTGPHKLRECLPLGLILRNRLNNNKFADENTFKLCRVNKLALGVRGIPFITTHDGRTIRYPDPLVRVNDVVKVDLATGKMTEIIKFETGATCVVTKGKNNGRMGTITSRDKHPGGFDIINVKDSKGKAFATRIGNIFCIGKKDEANMISVPKGRGIKENILEERKKRFGY